MSIPKRCFRSKVGVAYIHFCYHYNQWPTVIFSAYPKHPGPDTGPLLEIEGVAPELMRELELLDLINYLSNRVDGEAGKTIREAVAHGLKLTEGKLPAHISTESRIG